jgi:hypothetical protein
MRAGERQLGPNFRIEFRAGNPDFLTLSFLPHPTHPSRMRIYFKCKVGYVGLFNINDNK